MLSRPSRSAHHHLPSGLVVGLDDFMLARQPFQRSGASVIALTAETSVDSQAIVMTRNAA